MVKPIAFAVFRLTTNWKRVGNSERQVGRLGALQDAVGKPGRAIENRVDIWAVGHQPAVMGERGIFVDRGETVIVGILDDPLAVQMVKMSVTIRMPSGGVFVISEKATPKSSGARTPSGTIAMLSFFASSSAA